MEPRLRRRNGTGPASYTGNQAVDVHVLRSAASTHDHWQPGLSQAEPGAKGRAHDLGPNPNLTLRCPSLREGGEEADEGDDGGKSHAPGFEDVMRA